MKIALFGGTFDPVHLGHIAVARAAAEKFGLGRVYFVPADLPPHKQKRSSRISSIALPCWRWPRQMIRAL